MQTLDEMLSRRRLLPEQYGGIATWIAHAKTLEAIWRRPAPRWRTLELVGVLIGLDADRTQPPRLSE